MANTGMSDYMLFHTFIHVQALVTVLFAYIIRVTFIVWYFNIEKHLQSRP